MNSVSYTSYSSDSIEANVGTAATHVEQGNVQLEKARDYQASFACFICVKCDNRGSVHQIHTIFTQHIATETRKPGKRLCFEKVKEKC